MYTCTTIAVTCNFCYNVLEWNSAIMFRNWLWKDQGIMEEAIIKLIGSQKIMIDYDYQDRLICVIDLIAQP